MHLRGLLLVEACLVLSQPFLLLGGDLLGVWSCCYLSAVFATCLRCVGGAGGVFVSEGEIFNVVSLQFSEIKAFSQPSEAKATLKVASHAVEIT